MSQFIESRGSCRPPGNLPSRRTAIQAGLVGLAGLSLADVLRLKAMCAERGTPERDTAVIYLLLSGGPTQFETYDPKPNAPQEIRGEFSAISTKVPGVQFSELMVRQAEVMDKLTILRSIHHPSTQHSSSVHLMQTGYYCRPESNINEMPSVGSCVAKLRGAVRAGVPPYVALPAEFRYGDALWVGQGNNPFRVEQEPNNKAFQVPNLTLLDGVTADRLRDRGRLRAGLDRAQRVFDSSENAESLDDFTAQAFEMVTSDSARQAFNISDETQATRSKYGETELGQRMLLARRLVEHGVRYVTVGTIGWDHHGDLWRDMKQNVPAYDQAVAALVNDLHERGLADRVLVLAMGEFGRTPRISAINGLPPGRDHWGEVQSILMAGGGLPGGQVVGSSDAQGGAPLESPYRLECVLAHVYRHLGIDPALTFNDYFGRPRPLLEIREPITELG